MSISLVYISLANSSLHHLKGSSSFPVGLHIPSHTLPSSYIWPGQVTLAQVICVCGGGESEREMFLLFNFPVLITFLLLFLLNSFGVKEVAE